MIRFLAFLVTFFVCSAMMVSAANADPIAEREVLVVEIDSPISAATQIFLSRALKEAETSNARVLIIRFNTPGGLLSSMQSMVQSLLEARTPTVVYVSPSGATATSAGVFIAMAANIAAMSPGTTIGAAHPVLGGGQNLEPDMRLKVENSATALITAIAEQRNRNVRWAERAVRESVSVTDREAIAERVVDIVATDLDDLLRQIENRTVTTIGTPQTLEQVTRAPRRTLEMSYRERALLFLTDPNVAMILGFGAVLGIVLEFYIPGAVLPGVVGVVCLLLALASAQVLPITLAGAALLVVAGVFFVIELLVPSFGIWGGAGILCLVLGALYFIDDSVIWGVDVFSIRWDVLSVVVGTLALALLSVAFHSSRLKRHRTMLGAGGLVGIEAVVYSDFIDSGSGLRGRVFVRGEIWNALAEQGETSLQTGQDVVVVAMAEQLLLVVRSVPREH